MAGMKESTQARQRKEERRQAFYRSMTERAQKERVFKGTAEGRAGTGVGGLAGKKARVNGVQGTPTATATNATTIVTPAVNKGITPITAYDPLGGYAAVAVLPARLGDHQHSTSMDQSVFALQMRLQAQEQALAVAATSPASSHLYNVAAAAQLQQQEERQQLLMAHRLELLKQRQCARTIAATAARSQAAVGRLVDSQQQQQEGHDQDTAASRSALALLMQQQRRIQDLEQQLARAPSPSLAPAAAAVAAADGAASKSSKATVVVDLVDDEDEDQGTTASSSHSSLASSHGKQPKLQVGPVPPLSAYALFLKDEWAKIMKHAKANNRGVNPNVLVQAIATKWKAVDQSILIRYAVLASQDKERYQRECAAQAYFLQQQQQQQHAQY
jgi:HMG (high mobility group) box